MTPKILFADNSKMLTEVMQYAFENEKIKADYTTTYAKVLSLIKHNPYNLIIIDLNLNGFDVLKRIKTSELNKKAEVFFIVEDTHAEQKKNAAQNGVTGWILKPFIPEKFVKTIKQYINKNYQQENK